MVTLEQKNFQQWIESILFIFFVLIFSLVSPSLSLLSQEVSASPLLIESGLEIGEVQYFQEGWKVEIGSLRIVSFAGSPWQIGQQMIHLLEEELIEIGEYYQRQMPEASDPISSFFQNTAMRGRVIPGFYHQTPVEYITELRGLAGQERGPIHEEILFSGVPDLFFNFGCTTIAAWGSATIDGKSYAAKNFDWIGPGITNHFTTLFLYQVERGYSFAHVGFPGLYGPLTGVNEEGLFLSHMWVQTVVLDEQEAMLNLDGLPKQYLFREVLQYASTLEEALEILKNRPRTVAGNLLLAELESQRALVVEFTPDHIRVRGPEENEEYLFSTNYFEDPFLQGKYPDMEDFLCSRYQRLQHLLPEASGEIDGSFMVDLLRDRPLRSDGRVDLFELYSSIANTSTMQSSIFSGDGMIYIADGPDLPSSDNRFLGFSLDDLLEGIIRPKVLHPPNSYLEHKDYQAFEFFRDALFILNEGDNLSEALEYIEEAYSLLSEETLLERGLMDLLEALIMNQKGNVEEASSILANARDSVEGALYLHPHDREEFLTTLERVQAQIHGTWERSYVEEDMDHLLAIGGREEIDEVLLLGPTKTKTQLFERYLPGELSIGEKIDGEALPSLLELTEMRLHHLGVIAGVRTSLLPTEEGFEVVVRMSDGEGFFVDPFSAIFGGFSQLASGQVTLPYYNLGGFAINPYLSYRYIDRSLQVGLRTPGLLLPVYHHFSASRDIRRGRDSVSGYWDTSISWEMTMVPHVWIRPSVMISIKDRLYREGREDLWLLGRLSLPMYWQEDFGDLKFSGEYLGGKDLDLLGFHREGLFHRLTANAIISKEIGERFQVQSGGMFSYLYGKAPLDMYPSLGGEWLRGHRVGDLVGEKTQALSLGFGWSFVPDLFMTGLFVDGGRLEEEGDGEVLFDTGLFLEIGTPMGPLSISLGSPVDTWSPVWNVSFKKDW